MKWEHEGLIIKIASRVCSRRAQEWDDLCQHLRMHAIRLMQTYKPSYNVPFSLYAWRKLASEASRFRRTEDAWAQADRIDDGEA